jgi:hypothetical protein
MWFGENGRYISTGFTSSMERGLVGLYQQISKKHDISLTGL